MDLITICREMSCFFIFNVIIFIFTISRLIVFILIVFILYHHNIIMLAGEVIYESYVGELYMKFHVLITI